MATPKTIAGVALAVFATYLGVSLASKARKAAEARRKHEEKLRPLIEAFNASGQKDIHIANDIRTLTQHTLNPHLQGYVGIFLGFSSFMGENIARIVMASPQGRTPEASFARFEQTNRLLTQYLHYPPDHPRAIEAIERTNYIHAKFPAIFDKYQTDMIYIWAEFAPFAPKRMQERVGAQRRFTSDELQAIWLLSRETMLKMGLNPPERWEDAEKLCYEFERTTMPQTKSSLRFSDILFQYFENVKPKAPPRFVVDVLCHGVLSKDIKHAAGIENPGLMVKLTSFFVFDILMKGVDFWQYYFAFTGERHSFPGEMGEDGLVERPNFRGKPMSSARAEDYGERFKIRDVNDKYEPGTLLPLGTGVSQ